MSIRVDDDLELTNDLDEYDLVDELQDSYDGSDDTGDPNGTTYFKYAGVARQTVKHWRITAIGKRPVDFIGRDMLIAAFQRDSRQWLFRDLIKNNALWIGRRTFGLREELRKAAGQVSAVHYLHALSLYRFVDLADESERSVLKKLLRCWPVGMQVRWKGSGRRGARDVCGKARQCPFCFARAAISLYKRLQPMFPTDQSDVLFLLARLEIADDLFVDNSQSSLRDRCKFIRGRVGSALIDHVKLFGASGGLATYTVGPQILNTWYGNDDRMSREEGFQHRIAVLARISTPRPELHDLLHDIPPLFLRTFPELGYERLDPRYTLLANCNGLRLMLCGSSVAFQTADGLGNLVGALSWPSWNLASYEQWTAYLEATKNMRLYSFWGDWISSPIRPRLQTTLDQPICDVRESVSDRLRRILDLVRPMLAINPELVHYGRVQLRSHLGEQGLEISERDARWLRDQLVVLEENAEMQLLSEGT